MAARLWAGLGVFGLLLVGAVSVVVGGITHEDHSVASRAEGGSAVVHVTDTGIGVPASDQKELFNRFFWASNATGRSIPGTGLGLAIVRMIVVNHDGDIEPRSLEGAGTTVTVRLPMLASAEPVGAAAEVLRSAGHQVGHGIAQRGEARSGGRAGIGQ